MLAASDQTRPGAWLDAAEKLYIAKVPIYNLVVEIAVFCYLKMWPVRLPAAKK